jgi:hypothetical protein
MYFSVGFEMVRRDNAARPHYSFELFDDFWVEGDRHIGSSRKQGDEGGRRRLTGLGPL